MAFALTTNWDIRTTGSDSNGGGWDTASSGTDYSQQNSAQVAFTDLVIGATNTEITSALNPFTSAYVGNIINVTGGIGFTVQRVQVVSVLAGVATCDKAVGTASSTGGTGNLGGSLANFATAVNIMPNSSANTGNTVWIQSGTYTYTSTQTLTPGGGSAQIFGYQNTHGDFAARPLITTATNSTTLITIGGATLALSCPIFQTLKTS